MSGMEVDRREFLKASAGAAAVVALMPELGLASTLSAADEVALGLIGAGRQGRAILTELQKLSAARVASVCDTDASRLESGLRRTQGASGTAEYRAMLDNKEITGVIIATPTHLHKQVALDAIAAGKHVYCEGPLAHTVEDARAMAQAATRAKTVFAVGHEARANPVYKLARTFYKTDAFRDLISMYAQHHQKNSWRITASDPARDKEMNWRLDPGVSLGLAGELGSHQFDVYHWWLGAYPTSVRGHGAIRLYTEDGRTVPDTIACDFGFESGARLHYQATLANSYMGRHEVFFGSNSAFKLAWTHGWMFKEADAPTQGWEVYANRQQFHSDEGITLIADATKLASQGKLKEGVGLPNSPLYYSLEAFLRSVIEGTPAACNAEEGARTAIVSIAASRSVTGGSAVAIAPKDLAV